MENHPPPEPAPPDASAEADPLAFTPVPRKTNRADGLNADIQQSFIRILAHCGSPRRAARAVGKAAFGFEQLRRAPGAESFASAWDAAIALFKAEEARRCAINADVVRQEAAGWTPARGPFANAASRRLAHPPATRERVAHRGAEPTDEELEQQDKVMIELLQVIVRKYLIKLEQERKARLDGRIAEADFYVRQVTALEVSLDMVSGDGMKILRDYRCNGHDLLTVAETPFSRLMDDARRAHWNDLGDPPRPEHPPRHLLTQHDGFATEPLDHTEGGHALSHEEQRRRYEEQHKRDADAQIAWEAAARQDYEERRAGERKRGLGCRQM